MSGLIAHAKVGFYFSLIDDMTNNDFYRWELKGISAFSDRAVIDIASQTVSHGIQMDSLLTTVVYMTQIENVHIQPPSIMSYETYKQLKLKQDIRDVFRNEYAMNFQQAAQSGGGEGIAIDVPFRIKSKAFRRIFGGDNIGLRVSGNITIDGKLSQQKLGQTSAQTNRIRIRHFKST